LLPELAGKYNPDVAGALVRLGRLAGEADRALGRMARERLDGLRIESCADRVAFDRRKLLELDEFGRSEVLRMAWRDAGWPEGRMDARRWRRLVALADLDSARVSVGAGVAAEMTLDRLILVRRAPSHPENPRRESVELPVPGSVAIPGGRVVATLDPAEPVDESVDLDRLALPLFIGWPEAGDRFAPLGLDGQSQPLADFFRGRRVARLDRSGVPLVRDQDGIVWVVGHRIGHSAQLTDSTRRVLGLRFERGED
jgi:tRNA(Ile)-lysidine synthase